MGILDWRPWGARDRVGVFVDGPNVFRDEFDVDLDDLRDRARDRGRVAVSRLYVDQHATPGLIQAAEERGFEVETTSGDVDVRLGIEAVELVCEDALDTVIVVSRDSDFKPVLEVARRHGIHTVAIAPGDHGRSDALQTAADEAFTL
ncbi:MAG: NYN domain-containing protein [Halococcoides sp.]